MVIVKLYDRYIPVDKIQMVRFNARPEATEIVIRSEGGEVTSATLPVLSEAERDALVTLMLNKVESIVDVKELVNIVIASREVDGGEKR